MRNERSSAKSLFSTILRFGKLMANSYDLISYVFPWDQVCSSHKAYCIKRMTWNILILITFMSFQGLGSINHIHFSYLQKLKVWQFA